MITMKIKTITDMEALLKKARAAAIRNLGLFGGLTRKFAQQSIKVSKDYASPGSPPHSRKGLLKKAIVYAVDKDQQNVIIGPSSNVIADAGHPHEFGGVFRGNTYPARPFMGPALNRADAATSQIWKNSIK